MSESLSSKIKRALGKDEASKAKAKEKAEAPKPVTPKSLLKVELKTSQAQKLQVAKKAKSESIGTVPGSKGLTKFLVQVGRGKSGSDAKSLHEGLVHHLTQTLKNPSLLSESYRLGLKNSQVLHSLVLRDAIKAAPFGHKNEVGRQLKELLTTSAFNKAYAEALAPFGKPDGEEGGALVWSKDLESAIATKMMFDQHTFVDEPLLKNDFTLEDIPKSVTGSKEFKSLVKELAASVAKNGEFNATDLEDFSNQLSDLLNRDEISDALQLGLSLSDGKTFMQSLFSAVAKEAPLMKGSKVEKALADALTSGEASRFFHQSLVGVGDRFDDSGNLHLGNKVYAYVGDLGSGIAGTVSLYRRVPPTPGDPGVVVKTPNGGDTVWGPVQEGHTLANGSGTGASKGTNPLRGVVHTKNAVLLVLPFAEFGSMESVVKNVFKSGAASGKATPQTIAEARLSPLVNVANSLVGLKMAKNIAHRDVAARNIVVNGKGEGETADFGLGLELEGLKSGEGQGATGVGRLPVAWMAPEQLGPTGVTGATTDAWSFAMTVFEVVTGERPFADLHTAQEWADAIRNFDLNTFLGNRIDPNDWPNGMDADLKTFFQFALVPDPDARPSMQEVRDKFIELFPGAAKASANDWFTIIASEVPKSEMVNLGKSVAATTQQPKKEWQLAIESVLKDQFTSDSMKASGQAGLRELLQNPTALYEQLVRGAVSAAPLADKEKVRAAMRDEDFIHAFKVAHQNTISLLPPEPLVLPSAVVAPPSVAPPLGTSSASTEPIVYANNNE